MIIYIYMCTWSFPIGQFPKKMASWEASWMICHGVFNRASHGARFGPGTWVKDAFPVFWATPRGRDWKLSNHGPSGWWFEPLWKIWKSIGMMTFPIYGKIKNGPNHQPAIEGVSGLLLHTALAQQTWCRMSGHDESCFSTWTRSNVVKPIQPCQAFLHDFATILGLNYVAMVWMEMGLLYVPKNGSFMSIKQHKATSSKWFYSYPHRCSNKATFLCWPTCRQMTKKLRSGR